MKLLSQYVGVVPIKTNGVRAPREGSKPWRAQLFARGRAHYLGSFHTALEAAKAYDNCAYYLSLCGYKYRTLNFPEPYTGRKDSPEMTERTRQAVEIYKGSLPPSDKVLERRLVETLIRHTLAANSYLVSATQAANELKIFREQGPGALDTYRKSQSPVTSSQSPAPVPKAVLPCPLSPAPFTQQQILGAGNAGLAQEKERQMILTDPGHTAPIIGPEPPDWESLPPDWESLPPESGGPEGDEGMEQSDDAALHIENNTTDVCTKCGKACSLVPSFDKP